MENPTNNLNNKHSLLWSVALLLLALVLLNIFFIFLDLFGTNGNIFFVVIAWFALAFCVVIYWDVFKERAEAISFVAIIHSLIFSVFLFMTSRNDPTFMISLTKYNLFIMFLDAGVLAITFLVSAVKLKQAINKKDRREVFKLSFLVFLSMILSPWSFLTTVWVGLALSGS